MTPRVLVNVVGLDPAASGGASRIAREVCRLHASAQREGRLDVVYAVGQRFAGSLAEWVGAGAAGVVPVEPGAHELPLLEAWKPDLIVSPLFGGAPFDDPARFEGASRVVFMPDAQALDLPELFEPDDLRGRGRQYDSLRGADRVVTLSEHARSRLLHHLPLEPERVAIVPAGVAVAAGPAGRAEVDAPFVLYGANDWPHKRHDLLVAAMVEVWRARPELRLVLTGSHRDGFAAGLCARHGCAEERVVDLGFVSDERLGGLYAAAEALVFPSRYEGFGMPIVEAMAAGCPVVCAPVTAIPEVAGDAALFVDSDSPADWARALVEELPLQRRALVERGRGQAERFAWEGVRRGWTDVLEPFWQHGQGGGLRRARRWLARRVSP